MSLDEILLKAEEEIEERKKLLKVKEEISLLTESSEPKEQETLKLTLSEDNLDKSVLVEPEKEITPEEFEKESGVNKALLEVVSTTPPKEQETLKLTLSEDNLEDNLDMNLIQSKDNSGINGKIIGFFGDKGTGKTKRAVDIVERYKRALYLDSEIKAHEQIDENFSDVLTYKVKKPVIHAKIPIKQFFNTESDVDIDIWRVLNERTFVWEKLDSYKYLMKNLPTYIEWIKTGKYSCVVVDNCVDLKVCALQMWLEDKRKSGKPRDRPHKFEWDNVDQYVRDFLFPIIHICKLVGVRLVLCYSTTGKYLHDTLIGTKEDAKSWLLKQLSYELWFENDYKVYCLKHPKKAFWEYYDEDENVCDYLFDPEFVKSDKPNFKEYNEFKYETLLSKSERDFMQSKGKNKSIPLG